MGRVTDGWTEDTDCGCGCEDGSGESERGQMGREDDVLTSDV